MAIQEHCDRVRVSHSLRAGNRQSVMAKILHGVGRGYAIDEIWKVWGMRQNSSDETWIGVEGVYAE